MLPKIKPPPARHWRVTFEELNRYGKLVVVTRTYITATADHAQSIAEKTAVRVLKVEKLGGMNEDR